MDVFSKIKIKNLFTKGIKYLVVTAITFGIGPSGKAFAQTESQFVSAIQDSSVVAETQTQIEIQDDTSTQGSVTRDIIMDQPAQEKSLIEQEANSNDLLRAEKNEFTINSSKCNDPQNELDSHDVESYLAHYFKYAEQTQFSPLAPKVWQNAKSCRDFYKVKYVQFLLIPDKKFKLTKDQTAELYRDQLSKLHTDCLDSKKSLQKFTNPAELKNGMNHIQFINDLEEELAESWMTKNLASLMANESDRVKNTTYKILIASAAVAGLGWKFGGKFVSNWSHNLPRLLNMVRGTIVKIGGAPLGYSVGASKKLDVTDSDENVGLLGFSDIDLNKWPSPVGLCLQDSDRTLEQNKSLDLITSKNEELLKTSWLVSIWLGGYGAAYLALPEHHTVEHAEHVQHQLSQEKENLLEKLNQNWKRELKFQPELIKERLNLFAEYSWNATKRFGHWLHFWPTVISLSFTDLSAIFIVEPSVENSKLVNLYRDLVKSEDKMWIHAKKYLNLIKDSQKTKNPHVQTQLGTELSKAEKERKASIDEYFDGLRLLVINLMNPVRKEIKKSIKELEGDYRVDHICHLEPLVSGLASEKNKIDQFQKLAPVKPNYLKYVNEVEDESSKALLAIYTLLYRFENTLKDANFNGGDGYLARPYLRKLRLLRTAMMIKDQSDMNPKVLKNIIEGLTEQNKNQKSDSISDLHEDTILALIDNSLSVKATHVGAKLTGFFTSLANSYSEAKREHQGIKDSSISEFNNSSSELQVSKVKGLLQGIAAPYFIAALASVDLNISREAAYIHTLKDKRMSNINLSREDEDVLEEYQSDCKNLVDSVTAK